MTEAVEDWRSRERSMFEEAKRLRLGGEPPAMAAMGAETLRRAGYLAEFTALLLPGSRTDSLLAWADEARNLLLQTIGPAADWPLLAAVPGAPPKRLGALDALAQTWRISPALARDRYLSEEETLPVSAAPTSITAS